MPRTGNLDPNLISHQNELDLVSKFMCIKFENPKMKKSEIANQLGYSTSTLQSYRNDLSMLSPYRIHPNNTKKRTKKASNAKFDNNLHTNHDFKRPQMTKKDLNRPQSTSNENSKKIKTKNNLKCGFVQGNIEISEHYSDKILKNNDS